MTTSVLDVMPTAQVIAGIPALEHVVVVVLVLVNLDVEEVARAKEAVVQVGSFH